MMEREKKALTFKAVVKMLYITFLCFSLIGELQRTIAILWCNFFHLKD